MLPQPQDLFTTPLDVCFEVLLYLHSRMAKLPDGAILEFTSPDPGAESEIAAWCDLRGFTLLSVESLSPSASGEPQWRFLIQK